MNELHRQTYLSALGLDTYMPRFQLPFAPVSRACEIHALKLESQPVAHLDLQIETHIASAPIQASTTQVPPNLSPVGNLIGNIFDAPKVSRAAHQPITAADILSQLDNKPTIIEPFSLSVWRPIDGLMIVDSRNTKLALPTELLLQNILRSRFSSQQLKLQDEVLRWPAIENSFAKRSAADARNELQTWLSVQHEIRPFRYLFLMGENAATYLLPENGSYKDSLYKSDSLADSTINALISPSLNELLQKPAAKKLLQSALRVYLSANS